MQRIICTFTALNLLFPMWNFNYRIIFTVLLSSGVYPFKNPKKEALNSIIDKIELTAKTLHPIREPYYFLIIQRNKGYFKQLQKPT